MKTQTSSLWKIIGASSVGTLIEWYDFYIFGSLATIISSKFFPADQPIASFMATLATFAAGFVVRPFGALVFGRLGDLVGRKYTFMLTLLIMGGATFLIGCIPSYASIGYLAPLLVLILRLLQGLALGGEYGGAATYVAEHAPENQRGYWTSWIQTTASAGLFLSLIVIMITRILVSKEDFELWGWRVPFWFSIVMVLVSYIIRKNMGESPLFEKNKEEGKLSKNPLKESFGNKKNLKLVLLALFGVVMGQGVVWYTGQFYAMSFLEKVCMLDKVQSDTIMVISLLLGTPFFIVFGKLSDRIDRKKIMLFGMLIAALSYRPIYKTMYEIIDVKSKTEVTTTITSEMKKANQDNQIKSTTFLDGTIKKEQTTRTETKDKPIIETKTTITISGLNYFLIICLVFIQILFVTMVYAPIAAFLVDLFPTSIRYTSMSFPYHIGNGIFGGLLPAISTYLATKASASSTISNGTPYLAGLWYPIAVALACFVIGIIYLKPSVKFISNELIKKYLGYFWMGLALFIGYFSVLVFGGPKVLHPKGMDDLVFGYIILLILTPIVVGGLFLLGWYALKEEYKN
jgi:MFS family permease